MQRPGGNAEGRLPGKREKLKFAIRYYKQIKTFGKLSKKIIFFSENEKNIMRKWWMRPFT